MTGDPLIELQNVHYTYPAHAGRHGARGPVAALRDVSLIVRRGEHVALLGHNGSGKSTLARHCNALLAPDAGRVLVAGRDTRDPAARAAIRERVGMIFQEPDNQIIATLVEDDVAWSLAARGMPLLGSRNSTAASRGPAAASFDGSGKASPAASSAVRSAVRSSFSVISFSMRTISGSASSRQAST